MLIHHFSSPYGVPRRSAGRGKNRNGTLYFLLPIVLGVIFKIFIIFYISFAMIINIHVTRHSHSCTWVLFLVIGDNYAVMQRLGIPVTDSDSPQWHKVVVRWFLLTSFCISYWTLYYVVLIIRWQINGILWNYPNKKKMHK